MWNFSFDMPKVDETQSLLELMMQTFFLLSSCNCERCSLAPSFLAQSSWSMVCTSWCAIRHQIHHRIQDKVLPHGSQPSSGHSCADPQPHLCPSHWRPEGASYNTLFFEQLSKIWSSSFSSVYWGSETISPHEQDAHTAPGWLQTRLHTLRFVPLLSSYRGSIPPVTGEDLRSLCFGA